jgi:hypothetical protein
LCRGEESTGPMRVCACEVLSIIRVKIHNGKRQDRHQEAANEFPPQQIESEKKGPIVGWALGTAAVPLNGC